MKKKNKNAEILSPLQSLQLNQNGFNLSETSIEENFNRTKQVNSTFFAYDDRLLNRGRSEFKDYWEISIRRSLAKRNKTPLHSMKLI
ncbi:MAG: hypothetical protein IPJ43_11145 [Saprospiraceae bacterium]|nr:hypothetical protein [Saprospiraceae bacterium]